MQKQKNNNIIQKKTTFFIGEDGISLSKTLEELKQLRQNYVVQDSIFLMLGLLQRRSSRERKKERSEYEYDCKRNTFFQIILYI